MASLAATFNVSSFWRPTKVAVVIVAALGFSGCGEPSAKIEKTVAARGVLTYRGSPLGHYQVMFHPEDGRRPAAGVTDEQGTFVLGTNRADDGAVAGKHRVTVVYIGPPSPERDGMIEFSPPPPKIKIAAKYTNPDTSGIAIEIPPSGSKDLKVDLP